MSRTNKSTFISERDILDATRHFGHGTGASLVLKERHRRAVAEADRSRILQQCTPKASDVRAAGGLRRALGGLLVRIGRRLESVSLPATSGAPR
jgi:hypothetical protein